MSGGLFDSGEVADCLARLEEGVRAIALEMVETIFAAELARLAGTLQSEDEAPAEDAPVEDVPIDEPPEPGPPAAAIEVMVEVEAPVPVDDSLELGTVKWFSDDKGYGFIAGDDGIDVFVHRRSLVASGLRTLRDGQRVRYAEEPGAKGPVATRISAA